MSYKTILLHAGVSSGATHAAALAVRIAIEHEAHLIALASTGLMQLVRECSAVPAGSVQLPDDLGFLNQVADDTLASVQHLATSLGASAVEPRRIDDEIDSALLQHARYADLLVIAAAYGADDDWPTSRVHAMLQHCPRPVLLAPASGAAPLVPPGRRALLGWDGSAEAARAIGAALPLLRRGGLATLAIINAERGGAEHGLLPGVDMACYLARHGIALEVVQRSTSADAGSALLELAAERESDLLVMGAYGHGRLRELALGGATRTVLRDMALPVLLAH